MTPPLTNKTALITGASRGIGAATARTLAQLGARLILVARSADTLHALADTLPATPAGPPLVLPADLADPAAIEQLTDTIRRDVGRLDILINNAGITLSASLEQTTTADWDRLFALNARAPFLLCRHLLPLLQHADPAYIVNVASVVAVKGYPQQIAYSASKHALRGMSIALANELAQTHPNIRVHVLCPGGVDTELATSVRPDIPRQQLITPDEIAELIAYLLTHKGPALVDEIRIRRASSSPWF